MAQSDGSNRIVRRKLSHEVTDRLLEEIKSGALKPGDKLPSERDLMERYGVGRPAIREAMQSLESMGLVEITHGERATVKSLEARDMFGQIEHAARHLLQQSPETLEHLKETRLLFEVGMVKIAADRARQEDIEKLSACVDELRGSSGSPDAFVQADIRFHVTIASVSHNPILAAVSEAMLNWLAEFHQELVRAPGVEQVTISEHQTIFERIAGGDRAGAAEAMAEHLTRASSLYRLPA